MEPAMLRVLDILSGLMLNFSTSSDPLYLGWFLHHMYNHMVGCKIPTSPELGEFMARGFCQRI